MRLQRLLERLGPFWRPALLLFLAQRAGDAVNAFTGLWAIPRAIPSEALGALLPLTQFGAMVALPVGVVATVFTRSLCTYLVSGEQLRARSLLRDMLLFTLGLFVVGLAVAFALTPTLCRVLAIAPSAAAYFAMGSALFAALVPMATAALQATRRFGALALTPLLAAPARLAAMMLLLPLLGLSGYFLGQTLPLVIAVGIALLALWPLLRRGPGAAAVPMGLWLADGRALLRYGLWVALGAVAAGVQGTAVAFAVRRCLPAEASAAYYLLSRFAEIATYCGASFAFVLFPHAAAAQASGQSTRVLGRRLPLWMLGGGALLALGLRLVLPVLFGACALYAPYLPYVACVGELTLIAALNVATTMHVTHATARGNFRWLGYMLPTALGLAGVLAVVRPGSLEGLLHVLLGAAGVQFLCTRLDARR